MHLHPCNLGFGDMTYRTSCEHGLLWGCLFVFVCACVCVCVCVCLCVCLYLNALVRANVTPRMLRSSNERRLALPPVRVRQSRLFSFVVPRWWNELPITTRAGASLSTFKKLLKTQLFREHLPS